MKKKPFMFKKDDIANLNNIIWAIQRIEKSISGIKSVEELVVLEEKFDSIVVMLMNIGESAYNLSEELKYKNSDVDWNGMYKMRNIITHSYHSLDETIVWDIILNELPEDKIAVEKLLQKMMN